MRRGGGDEVDALLLGEAGDDAQQGHLGVLGQAEAALEGRLANRLARLDGVGAVVGGQVRVVLGRPGVVIDAVDDAGQLPAGLGEHAVHAATVVGRLDLTGVGRADGVEQVAEDDAGLEEVDVPVELELARVEEPPVEAEQAHVPVPEHALKGDVVDGEQGADTVVEQAAAGVALGAVRLAQVDGDEPGLPVVGVDDLGPEIGQADGLEDGAVKEGETRAVIGVVAFAAVGGGLLVEAAAAGRVVALEEVGLLDQPDGHGRAGQGGPPQPALDRARADGEAESEVGELERRLRAAAGGVERQDDGALVAAAGEGAGQRADDVGEAAGLGEADHLGGGEQNTDRHRLEHVVLPPL